MSREDLLERGVLALERIAAALEGGRPLTPAERAKKYREEKKKRHGERDATVTESVTRLRAPGDAAFGMTVDAWTDGIRSSTGGFFPAPRGRAAGELVTVLQACASLYPAPDECESARLAGEDYAKGNPGRTLDVFDFGRWIGSGRPRKKAPGSTEANDKRDLAKTMAEAEERVLANARKAGIQ